MTKAPLFSTYRQGENRVTSSILAVFERIDFGRVEELLAAASGESALEMVRFMNQPPGRHSVPDARIAASFHYLFEVKTEPNALGARQLGDHLELLDGAARQERLFVLTPDPEPPSVIAALDDERLVWLNFAALSQAIDGLLGDPASTTSEREAFLLRELQRLFEAEGLLGPDADVVVVAARDAYPNYLKYSIYGCQLDRSFRRGVQRMGFYTRKAIQRELPRIEHREPSFRVDLEEVQRLERSDEPFAARKAQLIRRLLADSAPWAGTEFQLFLLSEPESPDTLRLPRAIEHRERGAWTQGQRYASLTALEAAPRFTDELGEPPG